jgi:hypothetical protein
MTINPLNPRKPGHTMTKKHSPELTRTINQQAHMLAGLSFAAIRMTLEEKARALLKEGKGLDETLRAIRTTGTHNGLSER